MLFIYSFTYEAVTQQLADWGSSCTFVDHAVMYKNVVPAADNNRLLCNGPRNLVRVRRTNATDSHGWNLNKDE